MTPQLQLAIQQFLGQMGEHALRHAVQNGVEGAWEILKELGGKFKEGWDSAGSEAPQLRDVAAGVEIHQIIALAKSHLECPPGQPIKASVFGFYYLPGDRFYADTKARKYFATEAEAEAAGYLRPGKNRRASPKNQRQQKSKNSRAQQNPQRIRAIANQNSHNDHRHRSTDDRVNARPRHAPRRRA